MDYEFDDEFDDDERASIDDEAAYVCDSCGEEIIVPLDYSAGQNQRYVEDCPVCCHPNVIVVDFDENGRVKVWSSAE